MASSVRPLLQKVKDPRPSTATSKKYLGGIAITVFHTALALVTARKCRIDIFGSGRADLPTIILVVVFLAISLGATPLQWKYRNPESRRRLWAITPVTPGERWVWVFISVLAGVGEEIIFRAVAYKLLLMLTGSAWTAALLSAGVFGLVHIAQGWLGVASAIGFALGFQLSVAFTGALYAAILVHTLYDLVAGLVIGAWGKREFLPVRSALGLAQK